jgi:aminopeptidase N
VHEMMHAWFQGLLATNESLYAWMDEGFTSYASEIIMANLPTLEKPKGSPHEASYKSYFHLQSQGIEEPLTTHADHYLSNAAYGVGVYSKGAVFLAQLVYIIGQQDFDRSMQEYFKQWRFKHPTPNDFIRVVEKITKLELDWYKELWVNTINFIDYSVKKADATDQPNQTRITLERIGRIPMPIELIINYEDPKSGQTKERFVYIPLDLMQGLKNDDFVYSAKREIAPIWYWTHPTYELIINDLPYEKIQKISIDPSQKMADIKKDNNTLKLK